MSEQLVGWTLVGDYKVSTVTESKRVFIPKKDPRKKGALLLDAKGKVVTLPIRIMHTDFTLTHSSGGERVFRRYYHRGQWGWKDMKDGKRLEEVDVLREVARMTCGGDVNKAAVLLTGLMV